MPEKSWVSYSPREESLTLIVTIRHAIINNFIHSSGQSSIWRYDSVLLLVVAWMSLSLSSFFFPVRTHHIDTQLHPSASSLSVLVVLLLLAAVPLKWINITRVSTSLWSCDNMFGEFCAHYHQTCTSFQPMYSQSHAPPGDLEIRRTFKSGSKKRDKWQWPIIDIKVP